MAAITKCKVRMYRVGTGDCFLLTFFSGNRKKFKMMIDGGVWQGSGAYLEPFAKDILDYTDGKIDLLVITHEHKDHVLMFERCKEIFKQIEFTELWFGWTEKDNDPKVEKWKKKYGDKKKALQMASEKLKGIIGNNALRNNLKGNRYKDEVFSASEQFSSVLNGFSELHVSEIEEDDGKVYKGSLKGMHVVKEELNVKKVRYCSQGEIIGRLQNLEGIKFYVLGPPDLHETVEKESGESGESYDHNKDLEESELFAMAVTNEKEKILKSELLPFARSYISKDKEEVGYKFYNQTRYAWRKIDFDWLFGGGNLALRMNSLTNNLSLALAIEFEESGKVMLFPGDAEFGSWESWHRIKWPHKGKDGDTHLTEDLLKRTIFYKVAHHLSHNGTAQSMGLDMMTHEELVAMATLDYDIISKGWKSTMPNRAIINDLLKKTKGRLIVTNEENLPYDFKGQTSLSEKIKEARMNMNAKETEEFNRLFKKSTLRKLDHKNKPKKTSLYYEYTVYGK